MVTDGTRRCEKAAILGGSVCGTHGGGAPQVKKAAHRRLQGLVDPAIEGLEKSLKSDDDNTVIRAATVVLDRTGHSPSQKIVLEVEGLGAFIDDLLRVKPDLAGGISEGLALLKAEKEVGGE